MEIRVASAAEIAPIRDLLACYALPTLDIDAGRIQFLVAIDASSIIGVVGLEIFEDSALLRSLAVRREHRDSKVGAQLVEAAETRARECAVSQLFLLTKTASAYFAKKGFAPIERAIAPVALQDSAEFRSLCPSSATCMGKML